MRSSYLLLEKCFVQSLNYTSLYADDVVLDDEGDKEPQPSGCDDVRPGEIAPSYQHHSLEQHNEHNPAEERVTDAKIMAATHELKVAPRGAARQIAKDHLAGVVTEPLSGIRYRHVSIHQDE